MVSYLFFGSETNGDNSKESSSISLLKSYSQIKFRNSEFMVTVMGSTGNLAKKPIHVIYVIAATPTGIIGKIPANVPNIPTSFEKMKM